MIQAIVSDFSRVILFPKDNNYKESLNLLHKDLSQSPNYHIFDHFRLNIDLLNYYTTLLETVDLYIFTTDTIQNSPEFIPYLEPVFKKIFSAKSMNLQKTNPSSYTTICTELRLEPSKVLYIDDIFENIQAAKMAGLATSLYKNNELLFKEIAKIHE
ncbi:hypothetical protein CO180_00545 [candidate division WWE3 bacterium CG_4_9_14_3_um_filter_41_6]|uniref:Uncharacterized protein n=1 Tax=candidate division WWE3 bacterium CG_4_10_14_0_2_um_filter_41_14 TaxID=1975072 RepID=A0A2M7TL78_UNCKA|nr:MAG: hypothetical protein COY32_01320 [candidate division WWE3 bacterium CG_4_10_14_0_2_um_filter_41_14]PJA39531.1 MAG: hypothetical protein CO180_00545 [candidate division WWE3 bacterium CG_4_9_14_3_um_filter_41_6]